MVAITENGNIATQLIEKEMLKRLLTLMVFLIPLLSYSYDISVNGNSYDIISVSDRTVEIMKLADYENPTIPSDIEYNGITFYVIGIGHECFKGTAITSFEIPSFITQIGLSAFSYCHNLKEFTIPKTITLNAGNTFDGCSNLEEIIINADIPSLGMEYKGSVGARFASYCTSLTYVQLPNNLKSIDCDFIGCTALKNIVFTETLVALQPSAFKGCTSLDNIVFPKNVSFISNKAFADCTGLSNLEVCSEVPPTIFDDTFPRLLFLDGTLTVPIGSLETYRDHPIWGQFLNIQESTTTNIQSIHSDSYVRVYARGKRIIIEGKDKKEPVEVFSITGLSLYVGFDSEICVNQNGIFIVNVGSKNFKINI